MTTSNHSSPDIEILEVPMRPAELPKEDWLSWEWTWAYQGMSENEHANTLELWGNTDKSDPLVVLLANLAETSYTRIIRHIAVRPGGRTPADVLGTCSVYIELQDGEGDEAAVWTMVRPDARRQGIGTALFAKIEEVLAREGRTTVDCGTYEVPEPAPGEGVITAPTGSGRISVNTDAARFVMQRGFVLGQVGRESRLDMPSDLTDLRRHRDEALVKAGADYRLHFWDTEVPEQFHEGCAALLTAQSTEMPHGEIDRFESVWDAARYREQLETIAKGGERFMVLAAEHVPTGELVAYNEIGVAASGVSGWQGDMIVLPAHRGHRLGLLTLAEGLLRMAELCPTVERVYTWNAEENVPALAISVACGFRPAGVEAEWQRKR